jgi:hypothetical protein
MKTPTCIEFLKCYFTPEEKADISERMARAMQQFADTEEEFVVVKKQFNEQLAGFSNEAKKLSRRYNFGYEHRSVVCDVLLDTPEPGKKTIMRQDIPGELVRVMDMTDSDRQLGIPGMPERAPDPTPQTVADAIQERLPAIEAELQAMNPDIKVSLSMEPDAAAVARAYPS